MCRSKRQKQVISSFPFPIPLFGANPLIGTIQRKLARMRAVSCRWHIQLEQYPLRGIPRFLSSGAFRYTRELSFSEYIQAEVRTLEVRKTVDELGRIQTGVRYIPVYKSAQFQDTQIGQFHEILERAPTLNFRGFVIRILHT